MSELADTLFAQADRLDAIAKEQQSSKVSEPLRRLRKAADEVGRAWCGSWIGYQSCVYYANLEPTPPGAHFSIEWGFMNRFSNEGTGDWSEFTFDGVRDVIFSNAAIKSLSPLEKFTNRAKQAFDHAREEFLSISTIAGKSESDPFLSRLRTKVEEMKVLGKLDYLRAITPTGKWMTRDTIAGNQGLQTPPHIAVLAEVAALEDAPEKCGVLAKILRRAASHLKTQEKHKQDKRTVGTKVFLGHGRASAWKDLKDFIQDRMELPWDEFNRVPVAGTTNIARLSQMLDEAAIAFIVMTAEDEQLDGTVRARMNVIHEAGLFQGKLGFSKAILILEEGCEEFSNVQGLGQIRFPKGNIKAAFEDIRLVLEREELVES